MLNARCDRSHDHTPCAGRNTLMTQGYTQKIVDIVHHSIQKDIARMNGDRKAKGVTQLLSYAERSLLSVGIEEMEASVALAIVGR